MSHISVENVDFGGAPTLGGFQHDCHPLQLRGIFAFPILRLYGILKAISRIATLDESRFGRDVDLEGAPKEG